MSTTASALPSRHAATLVTGIVLIAALMLLLDGPVWLVKLVPTQDGPVHLAQADMIARFGWGGTLDGAIGTFYQWNPRVEPNSAIYLLLAGLIRATGNPLIANTIFLSLYGLLWIAAAFAAAQAETDRPLLPMLLLLPLAFGIFIHWGFYNYAMGVPLFLLFACYWRRLNERRDLAAFLTTALFLLGLCLTHLTTVVAACLLMASSGIVHAIDMKERAGLRAGLVALAREGAWAVAAALPVLMITASFLVAYHTIPAEAPGTDGGLIQIARRILAATYLFSFSWWEVVALAPLLGAIAAAGVAALRRFSSGDLLWPVFLVLVLGLSVLNLKTGSASLSERLAPLTWIAVVLAIASRQGAPELVRTLCFAAFVGLAGQSAIRSLAYLSWAPTLESELEVGRANPGQTFISSDIMPLHSSALFSWRVRPTLHASQTAALAAHGAGLSSPLPSTRYFGYFPLQYRPERDFMRATPDWEYEPDAASIAAFRKANPSAPDVLIISSINETGLALAQNLGYRDCTPRQSGLRSLIVCAPRIQLSSLQEHP